MSFRTAVAAWLTGGALVGVVLWLVYPRCGWLAIAIYAIMGLIAIAIERGRYTPQLAGLNFEPTDERFMDPVSGEELTVWVDLQTGERDYRPHPGARLW